LVPRPLCLPSAIIIISSGSEYGANFQVENVLVDKASYFKKAKLLELDADDASFQSAQAFSQRTSTMPSEPTKDEIAIVKYRKMQVPAPLLKLLGVKFLDVRLISHGD